MIFNGKHDLNQNQFGNVDILKPMRLCECFNRNQSEAMKVEETGVAFSA